MNTNKSPRRKPGDSGYDHHPACHADPGNAQRPGAPGVSRGIAFSWAHRPFARGRLAPRFKNRRVSGILLRPSLNATGDFPQDVPQPQHVWPATFRTPQRTHRTGPVVRLRRDGYRLGRFSAAGRDLRRASRATADGECAAEVRRVSPPGVARRGQRDVQCRTGGPAEAARVCAGYRGHPRRRLDRGRFRRAFV